MQVLDVHIFTSAYFYAYFPLFNNWNIPKKLKNKERKMTQKHIAFLAGTDPIVGYRIIEKELRSRYAGLLAIKKPLNHKQGFLLADFSDVQTLNEFLVNKKIDVFERQVLVSPYLTGEARQQKQ
jgi:hypothetical protein